ncbi:MAG: DMT family transporter [Clostridia bacterium]|nr:DMT family transporter [Clostridia bacterium]
MIYLILAILSSASINIVMRLSNGKVKNKIGMLVMNYVMCTVLSAAFTGFDNLLPKVPELGETMAWGVLDGILYLAGFVLLQLNIRKNGVVLTTIFAKLGLLVPMVLSIFLFNEMPSPVQGIGFALAIVAMLLINFEKNTETVKFKAGLVMVLLAGGACDAMSKVYNFYGSSALNDQFVFYTFVVALLLCVALMFYKKERPGKYELLFGLLVGIPNFFSARFLLKSVDKLPAVIVYPTFSVAGILVVTLAGVLFFKEKLSKRQWMGAAVILAALVLLNI